MSKITNVITLAEYANKHDMDVKRLRRVARKDEWPNDNGPFKFGGDNGIWAIDVDAPTIVLPAKSARGSRRADGRQRHIVFANAVELDAIKSVVGVDNVIDPRVASKLRRDAHKLVVEHDAELYDVPMTELSDGTLVVATENDVNG